MSGSHRRSLLALLVTALWTAGHAAPENEPWHEIRSEHFTLYAQSGEGDLRKALFALEAFHAVLDQVTGLRLEPARPVVLYVFDNSWSYDAYGPDTGGKHTTGVFLARPEAGYLLVDGTLLGPAQEVLYHEYVHSILRTSFGSVPLWLNEGLAEFYSTFRCDGRSAETGRPVGRHVRWLASHPAIPLERIFEVDHESPEYNEQDKAGVFYAESWALVHMLFRGDPALRAKSTAFLAALLAVQAPDEAARTTLGVTVAELEARLFAYVKQTEFTYTSTPLEGIDVAWVEPPVKLDLAAKLSRLGEVLFASGKESRAEELYRAAIAVDPKEPRAIAGLAALRFEEGKCDEARALYDRAVEAAPADPMILFQAGYHTLLEEPQDRETVLRARWLLERSTDLSDANAQGFALLGLTYALEEEDVSPGIAALEKAASRLPVDADILLQLIDLHARKKNRAGARDAMARLLPVGSPDEIAEARDRLVALDVDLGSDAFEDGDVDLALELLRGAERAANDPAVAKEARERIAEVETWLARQRDRDRYNSVVPLYKAGKWAAARRALQDLLVDCKTEEVCKAARAELATLPK